MGSSYDIQYLAEPTGLSILDGVLYICDSYNYRVSRLNIATMSMIDSYDMTENDVPLAILARGTRCYVLVNHWTDLVPRVDLWVYNIGTPPEPMTLYKTATISSSGVDAYDVPPHPGGLFLQYGAGYLRAACFGTDNRIIGLDLDGNVVSTTVIPKGTWPLFGLAIG